MDQLVRLLLGMNKPTLRCPICKAPVDVETATALPFCSPRCREIDLGRWLDERYAVEGVQPPDDEEEVEG